VNGEAAARQAQVGNELLNNPPPPDADEGVTGELWAGDLLPLVQAIAHDETAGLASLYDATVGKVVAVARAVLHNVEDAEEVTCDVYMQVWRTARDFDATQGSVLGWLLTIARNRSIDMLRQRECRQRALVTDQAPKETADERVLGNPEDLLGLFQSGMVLHRVLAALTPLRRELVGMAFFRGLSHAEIAAEIGLPVGTVKSHIRRALDALRDSLEG
jgi:RNA polymerase sigma-70 factor (ECF subfamily)